jgi:hypothetical protein
MISVIKGITMEAGMAIHRQTEILSEKHSRKGWRKKDVPEWVRQELFRVRRRITTRGKQIIATEETIRGEMPITEEEALRRIRTTGVNRTSTEANLITTEVNADPIIQMPRVPTTAEADFLPVTALKKAA